MQPRPFGTVECMVDALDMLAPVTFTTVGRVRGAFSDAQLRAALSALVARHPLLGCRIERRGFTAEPWFVPDVESARPTLEVTERAENDWQESASLTLVPARFPDDGPRLRCVRVRHTQDDSTLLLAFHHVVGDGKSGVFAMRDLVHALDAIATGLSPASEELAADDQNSYFPSAAAAHRNLGRALRVAREQMLGSSAASPGLARVHHHAPPEVLSLALDRTQTAALIHACRERGCTVHGRISSALMLALASQSPSADQSMRFFHPVDMRQYLRTQEVVCADGGRDIGEAVGCYVSFVDTQHQLQRDTDPWTLARTVSREVHARLDRGDPFYTSPLLGKMTRPLLALVPKALREDVARSALAPFTTGLTNLGVLERLGLDAERGKIRLAECHFAAAPSTISRMGVSATCYAGQLRMNIVATRPGYTTEAVERLRADLEAHLAPHAAVTSARQRQRNARSE